MSLPLDFHPEFDHDTESAFNWHERQSEGLGVSLLDEVQRVLDVIAAHPARFGYAELGVREGLTNRFSYAIYYRELPGRIQVVALWHT